MATVDEAVAIANAAWEQIAPGIEGLFRFLSAHYVSPEGHLLAGTRLVRCGRCGRPLYRTRGLGVVVLTQEEQLEAGEALGLCTVRPVLLRLGDYLEFVLCSRECAAATVATEPDTTLFGGYRL